MRSAPETLASPIGSADSPAHAGLAAFDEVRTAEELVVNSSQNGGGKDTWVLG